MKKLPLILTISFFVVVVGGYIVFDQFFSKKSSDPWNLVPESSVLVYEAGKCAECIDSLAKSSVWSLIQKAAFYARPSDSLNSVYDFLINAKHKLVSLHVTKKDDFDFVFYSLTDPKTNDLIVDQWKKNKKLKFTSREFNSVKIQEVSYGKHTFSWLFLNNVWVGSFTPFLIEDVIRTYEADNENNFKKRISDVYQMPGMTNEGGNLYIHFRNFSDWLTVFSNARPTSFLQKFGKSSILDVKTNGKNFILNGFSSDSVNQSKYGLSIFLSQTPVPFTTKKLISNRTVMLSSYGISDGVSFKKNLMDYAERKGIRNDTLNKLSVSMKINIDQLYENIKGEIGVCFVESKGQDISKVMLVETLESKSWIETLNAASARLSLDTVFFEKYSDYEIRELQLFRFPEKLFWPLLSGFDRSYYTAIGNTVIMAEDLEELKKFLEDIDKEETWGKSVSQNRYLESTLLESNISLYINTPRIWNILSGTANPKWKRFISENQSLLKSLGMGAIQFSHLSESFYTNISWSYKQRSKELQQKGDKQRITTNIPNAIAKMVVLKNHTDKHDEALVQDSLNNLYLISAEGKVLWQLALNDLIVGNVEQVDYYNNGKLQYFFATKSGIHILDRLGKYVTPFPVVVPASDIEHASIVDYDHSRKYRFIVASKTGKLWMYDKEGNNLEGWRSNDLESALLIPPRHHRIRGKDYIVCIRRDGKVFLLNRRGETLKHFPVNLDAKPSGEYFLEAGVDLDHTYFVMLSRDGYRIKFDLHGKIQSKETLLKNSPLTQFSLVAEQTGKSYLMLRQESKQLTLMDEDGKELISNDFIGLDPADVQYVDFGAGKTFITITDTRQDLSFIYDGQGNLLTIPPLESNFVMPRHSDNDKVTIFIAYKKALSVQPLEK